MLCSPGHSGTLATHRSAPHHIAPRQHSHVCHRQVEEYSDEVFDLLDNGAHIYFCGLKGMMPGIQDMLERVAGEKGCALR